MAEMSVLKVIEHGRLAILPTAFNIKIPSILCPILLKDIVFFTILICSQRLR